MPKDHLFFMIFLFYDSNNDGVICDRDMLRIMELTNKCPLLKEDYMKIRKYGGKYPT